MNEQQLKDLEYIWHPCSQMKDYEDLLPLIIDRGEGAYVIDIEGKRYMDAISSWWVNLFGHCNKDINDALKRQVDKLEHVIFANFSHKPAIELAERIVAIVPDGLKKVFFADNGSSAIEAALKMSFQYHKQTSNSSKTKFVAVSGGYHGETIGALSVGGVDLYSAVYKPLLPNMYKVAGPDCYRCKYGQNRESCQAECFAEMEELLAKESKNICAVVIEPMVQGTAGMRIYPAKYLVKLRALCTDMNVHFIADEILVGFGRTGKMFACSHANISPDIMCLSKGLTGGYLPLSLVVTTKHIYNAFYADYVELRAFLHSHSYTANPLACAAAIESLNIFERNDVLASNARKSKLISDLVHEKLVSCNHIGEFRQLGMISALELVENVITKQPFDWKKRTGYQVYKLALTKGLILRPLGDVMYFMPPYVATDSDIKFMIDTAFCCIKSILN